MSKKFTGTFDPQPDRPPTVARALSGAVSATTSNKSREYGVTPYRWLVLAFFAGCLFNTALVTISLSPISKGVAAAYGTTVLMVNLCSTASCFWYIPMTAFAQYMYGKYPKRYAMIIAAILQLTGGWFR